MFDADKRWVNNTCWIYSFFLTLLLYVAVCGTLLSFLILLLLPSFLKKSTIFLFTSVNICVKVLLSVVLLRGLRF